MFKWNMYWSPVGKHLSDTLPIKSCLKQEMPYCLSFFLFFFFLKNIYIYIYIKHTIRRVQQSRRDRYLMAHISFWYTLVMLVYWVKPYILQRKTEAILVPSEETGLEGNAEKAKYVYVHVSRSRWRTVSQHKDR